MLRQSWRADDDLPLELRPDGALCKLGRGRNVVHGQRPVLLELGLGFAGGELTFQYDAEASIGREDGGVGLTGVVLGRSPHRNLYLEAEVTSDEQESITFRVNRAHDNGEQVQLPQKTPGTPESPPGRWLDFVLQDGTWGTSELSESSAVGLVMEARRLHLDNGRKALNAVQYIGPLRLGARRHYDLARLRERRVRPDGRDFAAWLNADPDCLQRVNEWLSLLGVHYQVEVFDMAGTSALGELQLVDPRHELVNVGLPDVGCGVSQLLPVLTQLALAVPEKMEGPTEDAFGQVILVEQPELHLHPGLQARFGALLGRIVAQLAGIEGGSDREVDLRKRTQIIVETHSEHIINGVRHGIVRGEVPAEDVSCLAPYCRHGSPQVEEITLNRKGDFEVPWPDGFFDVVTEES